MALETDTPAPILNSGGFPEVSPIDGTNESSLPSVFHLAPCYGAAYELATHLGKAEIAADAKRNWDMMVDELKNSSANRLDRDVRRISINTGKPGYTDYRQYAGINAR